MPRREHIAMLQRSLCRSWSSVALSDLVRVFVLVLLCPIALSAQVEKPMPGAASEHAATVQASSVDIANAVPLDRVIAVVNNQVILASDLDLELRFDRLVPINNRADSTTTGTLQRLITRALIEQQILQEDPHGLEVPSNELEANLNELRQNLPACKKHDCISAVGWATYLTTLGLTPQRVEAYWSNRMALLRFIEQRFRSGIRITPEEIQKYYLETLLPQYASPVDAPLLERISPRIQEILLQQQVTALFNDWLKSLKDQGQIEVVDPSLQAAATFLEDTPPSTAPQQTATPGISVSVPSPSATPGNSAPALTTVPTPPQPAGPHDAAMDETGGNL
ncbi:SurA N-terminal domain-containing protein [Acidicapsa ligni]|uniref:peptidylprolyl isomerase n=1 Tax=Acidicapsa ligni TaxID=542300 RepID=UPI0021E062E4|nr:peptidylprolyl isomerase [Acidicapsa ligni]